MNYVEEREAILKRFLKNWDTNDAPVMVDGEPGLTKGTSNLKDEKGLPKWTRIQVLPAGSLQADMGSNPRVRYSGVINIGFFATAGSKGAAAAVRDLYEKAHNIFHLQSFDSIICRDTTTGLVGQIEGYYQMSLQVAFYRDNF